MKLFKNRLSSAENIRNTLLRKIRDVPIRIKICEQLKYRTYMHIERMIWNEGGGVYL